MKHLSICLCLVMLLVPAFPANVPLLAGSAFTSLSAVTSTGAGDVGVISQVNQTAKIPLNYTWSVSSTGSPASVTINLEGSIDGTNFFTLDSSTSTSSEMRHVVNKSVSSLRCNLTTLTGGTAPKVTCKIAVF